MFKNSILRYLNSAAVFDTDDAIAKARASIAANVTVGNRSENEPKQEENNNNENDEGNNDGNSEEDGDGEDNSEEGNDEGNDEKNTNENETDEQKQARLEQEKDERRQARLQKRIDKIVAERDLAKKEADALRKQLSEKATEGLTEEEVNRRAEVKAQEIINQRNEEEGKAAFERDCNIVQGAAIKADKDFMKNIHAAAEEVGPIPQHMIGILVHDLDNDNGGDVLAYLAKNVDEYEDIYNLSPSRMAAKLVRLSDKLKEEKAKVVKKPITKVPDPIKPVNEGRDARTSNNIPSKPTQNMDEFVRIRNEQAAAYRKQKMGR